MEEKPEQTGIVIPPEKLSESALIGLIDEFILREGTDYGMTEHSLDDKRANIKLQIQKEKVFIVFDMNEESTTLIKQEDLKKLKTINNSL